MTGTAASAHVERELVPAIRRHHDPMLAALDRLRDTSAEFGGFLANHGPMAADAMIRLGGGERVGDWVDRYRHELSPAPPAGDGVTADGWFEHLGRIDRLGDWNAYFRAELDSDGWQAVVATWWNRLLPGAAASATHGPIRTAHAVRNLMESTTVEPLLVEELGAGLAYWAARYQTLPGSPGLAGTDDDVGDAIGHLPRLRPGTPPHGPGIGGMLRSLGHLDGLPRALDAWRPPPDPAAALDELVSGAARVLLAHPGAPIVFCHAVTAPAAIRMILPTIPEGSHRATVATCWQLVASLVAAFGSTPVAADPDGCGPTPDPTDLAHAAIEHGDEHVVKLTEACIRQFDHTGDPVLLTAAERFRHWIEPRW